LFGNQFSLLKRTTTFLIKLTSEFFIHLISNLDSRHSPPKLGFIRQNGNEATIF